ncbi:glutamate receptor ionotropic, kainate 2-like [Rhipicephalus microplus]|uniref:glutamate receptor ionotropic, kainate 2-like n=1 Tax=Rhipicephalus microplus TaxID=6941 RepID=UPI003F6C398A
MHVYSQVGTWSASSGLNITRAENLFEGEILSVLKNKTLRITTILNAPYVMLKKSAHKLEGNDCFEGYCVDLLREISATLGFHYQLKLVRDGAYGTRDSQGRWNGIMRELVDMEADLAIGDLTITSEREQSVDFTIPFMTLGVSILYKKTDQKRSLLFFLSPLSGDVWLCVAGACVAVSAILCCVSRAQSAVCRGNSAVSRRYGCCSCGNSLSRIDGDWYTETDSGRARLDIIKGQEAVGSSELQRETLYSDSWRNKTLPTVLRGFTLPNSFWFIVSAIMRQECGIFPRAAPTRIIAATWWIFSFVLVSSYTANLAAFLTKERLQSPIESAEDLAKQSAVRYGCVRSGSTHALFKEWRHETYEMMWHAMKEDLVSSTTEGIERVENGGYAFLMESTSIEYVVRRRCQLKQIGGLLDSKGYGIATPHGEP